MCGLQKCKNFYKDVVVSDAKFHACYEDGLFVVHTMPNCCEDCAKILRNANKRKENRKQFFRSLV